MRIVKLDKDEFFFNIFIDNHYEEWGEEYKNKSISYNDIVKYYRINISNIYICITDDNKYIGCYSICNNKNLISDLLIVKKYRNKGYGKILLRDAIKKLNNRVYIILYCKNDKITFYEKFGFICIKKSENNLMIKLNYFLILLIFIVLLLIMLLTICFFNI
jgi:GNAT superfamily N-acetyltransferase